MPIAKNNNLLGETAKLAFLALAALLLASCGQDREEKVDVYVSIPPLLPFVQRLAGPGVKCESFMPSGANPHQYEPSPRKGAGFYDSKLFVMTGLPFEKELAKRAKGGHGPKLLDLAPEDADHDHDHEEEGHHHDPHIWLSPRLMKERVQDMAAALCELYPEKKEEIEKRAEEIKEELKAFDEELKETFKDGNKVFLVFHPAYSCFAEDYGLTEIAVEKEGSEPTPKSLSSALDKAQSENIANLIVQPGMNERLAKNIADTANLKIIKRDALSTNYYEELRALARNIKGGE
jgi:zinc transport system substrate-binding protein